MATELNRKLLELREEFELLNTMADAERANPSKEVRDCTDEQATRTGKVLDACIALSEREEGEPNLTADEAMEVIEQATDGDLRRNDPDLWEDLGLEFRHAIKMKVATHPPNDRRPLEVFRERMDRRKTCSS